MRIKDKFTCGGAPGEVVTAYTELCLLNPQVAVHFLETKIIIQR